MLEKKAVETVLRSEEDPRVSVLMAAYNASRFLKDALDDILAQTFQDFELVVVEDGSVDDTPAILQEYASRDPRIIVVENSANLGLSRSLNRGLDRCRAKLIARADADDKYPPDRLERQVHFLEENAEVGLLSGAVEKIDEHGNFLLSTSFPEEDGEIRVRELFINCFTHPGVMYRKRLVQSVGGYDPAYDGCEDAELWSRLRSITKSANLESAVVYYRKHESAATQNRSKTVASRSLEVRQRLLSAYLERSVSIDEAGAMQATFWARPAAPASPQQLKAGMAGLREVFRKAKEREEPSTVHYLRREVSNAMLKQSQINKGNSWMRCRLLAESALWDPALIGSKFRGKIGGLKGNATAA